MILNFLLPSEAELPTCLLAQAWGRWRYNNTYEHSRPVLRLRQGHSIHSIESTEIYFLVCDDFCGDLHRSDTLVALDERRSAAIGGRRRSKQSAVRWGRGGRRQRRSDRGNRHRRAERRLRQTGGRATNRPSAVIMEKVRGPPSGRDRGIVEGRRSGSGVCRRFEARTATTTSRTRRRRGHRAAASRGRPASMVGRGEVRWRRGDGNPQIR